MNGLPTVDSSLIVRTDFSNESAWSGLLQVISTESIDGFRAYAEIVSEEHWRNAAPDAIRSAIPEASGAAVLFIADEDALASPEFPVLVVDLRGEHPPFRCIARELWGPDNNLNLANMDFYEFAESVDSDGVFRGFPSAGSSF